MRKGLETPVGYAGGLRAMMSELKDLLNLNCLTVNGRTLGANLFEVVDLGLKEVRL